MTIIVVRDGVMATDSLVQCGGVMTGSVRKWAEIPQMFGGGYVAGAGDIYAVQAALSAMVAGRDPAPGKYNLIWLKPDGSVTNYEEEGWLTFDAPFYTTGSGEQIAIGALAVGATAREAVEAACKYKLCCGGEIHELRP